MSDEKVITKNGGIFSYLRTYFQRDNNLPNPNSYVNLNRECRSVFISEKTKFEGFNVAVVRPLTQMLRKYPTILFLHNFSVYAPRQQGFAQMMQPNDGYQFQCQYIDKKGRLVGVWSPSHYVTKISRKWDLSKRRTLLGELLYEKLTSKMKFHSFAGRLNYKNNGYCMEGKYKSNGEVSMGFSQTMNQNVTLGTQLAYFTKNRKTDLYFGLRYIQNQLDEFGYKSSNKPNMEIFSQLLLKDMGVKTSSILKASLFKKIEHNTKMAAEMEWNITKRQAILRYGFEQTYLSGAKFRVNMDHNFNLLTCFDFHVTPKTMVQIMTQANTYKNEYKFGVNMQFQ